jgi:uncharacterized protein (TIGR02145 family)
MHSIHLLKVITANEGFMNKTQFKFSRINGIYGISVHLVLFIGLLLHEISCNSLNPADDNNVPPIINITGTITDINGNIYHTVKIGTQEWTIENLRVTLYNDGSAIPLVMDSAAWDSLYTPGYCYYNNTTNADSIRQLGALYNWYVVETGRLAPTGWHVPTAADWTILENYLVLNGYNWDGTTDTSVYNKLAMSLAAKTDWKECTDSSYCEEGDLGVAMASNNSTSFSALPGGSRYSNGDFDIIGYYCGWWSSTDVDDLNAFDRGLVSGGGGLLSGKYHKKSGNYVRLLRD